MNVKKFIHGIEYMGGLNAEMQIGSTLNKI